MKAWTEIDEFSTALSISMSAAGISAPSRASNKNPYVTASGIAAVGMTKDMRERV